MLGKTSQDYPADWYLLNHVGARVQCIACAVSPRLNPLYTAASSLSEQLFAYIITSAWLQTSHCNNSTCDLAIVASWVDISGGIAVGPSNNILVKYWVLVLGALKKRTWCSCRSFLLKMKKFLLVNYWIQQQALVEVKVLQSLGLCFRQKFANWEMQGFCFKGKHKRNQLELVRHWTSTPL